MVRGGKVMIYLAALFAGVSTMFFIFGISQILKREIKASRFSAFKYDADEELNRPENIIKDKLSHIKNARDILLVILGGVIFGGIIYITTGNVLFTILGSFGGLVAPKVQQDLSHRKYDRLLSAQLEQAVESMGIVIRSGGGMPDAVERAALNVRNPLKKELEQASAEIRLGVPEHEVFRRLADRVKIPEMEMLSIAADLQKEGMAVNMANVLSEIQDSIVTRQAFQEEVRALTSENRMAVWIVAAVPIGTISMMRLFAPDFMEPLFNTFIGNMALVACTIAVIVGVIWALKIANTEDFL